MNRSMVCFFVFLFVCGTSIAQSAPATALPVANNVTSDESPAIQQFQKIEESWSLAVNGRDQYGLELVLSPLFVDVSATGDITTRNHDAKHFGAPLHKAQVELALAVSMLGIHLEPDARRPSPVDLHDAGLIEILRHQVLRKARAALGAMQTPVHLRRNSRPIPFRASSDTGLPVSVRC